LYEEFDYKSNVFASYASLSGGADKWLDFQLGLRMEYYDFQIKDKGTDKDFSSTAINLFPSVHLSKGLGQDHRFVLSYSRRVIRPDEWQLCPFVYSSDYFETRRGNPDLSQSLIDSYELSYLWSKEKFRLNTDLFHRSAHSPIGTYLLEEDGRFVLSYENLDKETNSGVEMMGMYTPAEWLQFRLSLSAYHSQWEGSLSDGNQLEGSSLQGNGSFSSTFTIKKNTSLQFLAIYYAPADIPQGHSDAFYYFDFILKHSFFNKKLILGLRTHNTFDSGLYHYSVSGSNYLSEGWYRYEGPVFIFNLTYKLNNFKPRASNPGVRMDFDSGLDL
jgi:outer membrane receptor protein involved in Fe transport